jgi:hypothetical protein
MPAQFKITNIFVLHCGGHVHLFGYVSPPVKSTCSRFKLHFLGHLVSDYLPNGRKLRAIIVHFGLVFL